MTTNLDAAAIQRAVRRKYAEVACSPEGKFKYPTGREGLVQLGYDLSVFGEIPTALIESFCGVGNPFSLGSIHEGEAVLDVGCGGGFDLVYASRLVGLAGRVCGVDITPEMVEKARLNLEQVGVSNGDVQVAGSEAIPYDDNTFDAVISNGALNLSPAKERTFDEIHRVLKPAGRLQFADIVLREDLPADIFNSLDAWSE